MLMALGPRILAGVLLGATAALGVWLLSRPSGGDPVIRAEFTDARGLVGGNDVRINGAPAGTVTSLTLTARGIAMVTMRLDSGLPSALRPRADATAAIRPVDLLGDNYVALEPGRAPAPLRGPIPTSRTLNAPRLSDLLSVFREPVRTGLQAILVELGKSLDQRGADLNQAALALRPTLQAADSVMRELGSQNADLRSVIVDSEAVTAQTAAHNEDLGRSVSDLNQLVQTTSQHLPGVGAGLAILPTTLQELTTTAADLKSTAYRAQPLAAVLQQIAPHLSTAAGQLPSFLHATTAAARHLHPTLRTAAAVLRAADPSLYALGTGLSRFPPISAPLAAFARAIAVAAPPISEGFFVNFPDQGSEPGNQPFDPFANALRDYWRGAGVMTCQAFGVPIAPGCLTNWLASGPSGCGPGCVPSIGPPGADRAPWPAHHRPSPPSSAKQTVISTTHAPAGSGPVPSLPLGLSSVAHPAAQPPPLRRLLSYLIGP